MSELISVLMCVYNTPTEYLKEAVDSILNQSYESLEFIIVNDCSSDDNVLEYLRHVSRSDSRICIVDNSENLGLTKSLNVGLEHCHGKYIARMDSDDISMPNRLQIQLEYMESHPEIALVGSDIVCFGDGIEETDTSLAEDPCSDPETYRINSLLQHSGPPHPTFMFRSEFLKDNGIRYREDILKAQDYGIMADILKHGGNISKIRKPLLRYRIHENQITAGSEAEQKAYQLRVSYDYISFLFPELSSEESLSIAMLGCYFHVEDIISVVIQKESVKNAFSGLVDDLEMVIDASIYIVALKKILKLNEEKKLFDNNKFQHEFINRWVKLVIKNSKYYRKLWGLSIYTIQCFIKCLMV